MVRPGALSECLEAVPWQPDARWHNGKTDIAVYSHSYGTWYIKGDPTVRWGIWPGDIPVTRGEK